MKDKTDIVNEEEFELADSDEDEFDIRTLEDSDE